MLDWPDQSKHPPMVVWRFKERDEILEATIKKAVESFSGEVDWEVDAMRALSAADPDFCEQAKGDVPCLAEHISQVVREVV